MNPSLEFVFDDREDTLHRAFTTECAARRPTPAVVRMERLVLGDILIYQTGSLWAAIERKRFDDLVSSRFDGRLVEQTVRLRQWQRETGVWVIVIVEGMPDASGRAFRDAPEPLTRYRLFLKTYVQCVCELPVGSACPDRCMVLRTRDVHETAALLHTLPRTLPGSSTAVATTAIVGPRRRSNGDPFVNQLCCTTGVSVARAVRVRGCFASPVALCDAWKRDVEGTRGLIGRLLGSKKVAERLEYDWIGSTTPVAPTPAASRTRVPQPRCRNAVPKSASPPSKRRGPITKHPSANCSQFSGICAEDMRSDGEPVGSTDGVECDPGHRSIPSTVCDRSDQPRGSADTRPLDESMARIDGPWTHVTESVPTPDPVR